MITSKPRRNPTNPCQTYISANTYWQYEKRVGTSYRPMVLAMGSEDGEIEIRQKMDKGRVESIAV